MPTDAELRLEGAYKVVEWMRVRNEDGHCNYDFDGLKRDLKHSALIRWLCAGNDALDEPPPVRMSRPDHRAAVEGRFEPMEVWVFAGDGSLTVDAEGWKMIEATGPDEWIAAYRVKRDGSAWSAPWRVKRVEGGWLAERLPSPAEK